MLFFCWHCYHIDRDSFKDFDKKVFYASCKIPHTEQWTSARYVCCKCNKSQFREWYKGTGYEGIGG